MWPLRRRATGPVRQPAPPDSARPGPQSARLRCRALRPRRLCHHASARAWLALRTRHLHLRIQLRLRGRLLSQLRLLLLNLAIDQLLVLQQRAVLLRQLAQLRLHRLELLLQRFHSARRLRSQRAPDAGAGAARRRRVCPAAAARSLAPSAHPSSSAARIFWSSSWSWNSLRDSWISFLRFGRPRGLPRWAGIEPVRCKPRDSPGRSHRSTCKGRPRRHRSPTQ